MTASCSGSRISLRSAYPADGWRVSPDDTGPEELDVKFTSDEREMDVTAQCRAGTPSFQTATD